MKRICFVVLILLGFNIQASEIVLLDKNSNDSSEESHILGQIAIELNDAKTVTRLIQRKIDSRNGKLIMEAGYTYEDLLSGVILEKKKGMDIIKMRAQNFSLEKGGELVLDFLANGITGKRKRQIIQARPMEGSWRVIDGEGKVVNSLKIETNKVALIGSIGIDRIHLLSTNSTAENNNQLR